MNAQSDKFKEWNMFVLVEEFQVKRARRKGGKSPLGKHTATVQTWSANRCEDRWIQKGRKMATWSPSPSLETFLHDTAKSTSWRGVWQKLPSSGSQHLTSSEKKSTKSTLDGRCQEHNIISEAFLPKTYYPTRTPRYHRQSQTATQIKCLIILKCVKVLGQAKKKKSQTGRKEEQHPTCHTEEH